jgi:hypothetical protein
MSSAANLRVAGSCHRIGPIRSPSRSSPCPKKSLIADPASASTGRVTLYRDAFSANTNPSGTAAAHLAKLSGFCRP